MEISVGVMAYNEGHNIGRLLEALLNQKTERVRIKEIIVVSSGSIDSTEKIVRKFSQKNSRIVLITQKEREGKASAINEFLKKASSKILVLQSADTLPHKDAIEMLCPPFQDKSIGIVASRPIPRSKKNNYMNFVVNLQWLLQHQISLENPKFGELIAFRNLFNRIGNTAVDEEYIAMIIKRLGFRYAYAQRSLVYNTGPKTISDFIKQRRRIYCGHLQLSKKSDHQPPTMDNLSVLRHVIRQLKFRDTLPTLIALLLEGYSRCLGIYDYYSNKNHYIWEIAETTKK
jgi:poly-beta-1,6-N-acetyl-D-glucosamine synthase